MGETTAIAWTHHTFNVVWGCTKVSPGCDNCYAATLSKRYGFDLWGKDNDRRFFSDKHWAEPLRWNKSAADLGMRRQVFCGSMCDVMEDRADMKGPRERLFSLIEQTPHLDWQLLTKRPQNFVRFLPAEWLANPRPNVWLMTTVESRDYTWRINSLLEAPAVVHGLSCEPLLGPLELPRLAELSWIIAGAESGHGARSMDEDWVRSLRDQCNSAGVAFFFKQRIENGKKTERPFLDGQRHVEMPMIEASVAGLEREA